MHELITSDLCDIDFDLSLSRGRSKNNRRKDKSCNNGRAAHDHTPFRGRAKTSLPDRALIIDTIFQGPPRSASVQQSSGIDPSSGSRFTAAAAAFFILSQSGGP